MFGWAIAFLIIAIVSGVFGFTGLAGAAVSVANVLFVAGLTMFMLLLLLGWRARRADGKAHDPAYGEPDASR